MMIRLTIIKKGETPKPTFENIVFLDFQVVCVTCQMDRLRFSNPLGFKHQPLEGAGIYNYILTIIYYIPLNPINSAFSDLKVSCLFGALVVSQKVFILQTSDFFT